MSISLSGITISGENAGQYKDKLVSFLGYKPAGMPPISLMDATSYEFDQAGIVVRDKFLLILDPFMGTLFGPPDTHPPLFDLLAECAQNGPALLFDINGMMDSYQYAYFENGCFVGARSFASSLLDYSDTLSVHLPALADETVSEEEKFMNLLASVLGIQFGFLLGEQKKMVEVFST